MKVWLGIGAVLFFLMAYDDRGKAAGSVSALISAALWVALAVAMGFRISWLSM